MGSKRKPIQPRHQETLDRRTYAKNFQPARTSIALEKGERIMPLNMHYHRKDYRDRTFGVYNREGYKYKDGGEPGFYGRLSSDATTFKLNPSGQKKAALGSG